MSTKEKQPEVEKIMDMGKSLMEKAMTDGPSAAYMDGKTVKKLRPDLINVRDEATYFVTKAEIKEMGEE